MAIDAPIRLLTYSTLYPNPEQPRHGVFVEQRLRHLIGSGGAVSRVVAPIPWFPAGRQRRSEVPRVEQRHGIPVTHPRYPILPGIGMAVAPFLLAAATKREVAAQLRSGYDFVAIDAHYFYPDGVAAALIARSLNKPLVVTARGSDVNVISRYLVPRRQIAWAARRCAAIVTVSQALGKAVIALGIPADRVTTLRNGVDLESFRPVDRAATRRRLGFDGPTLLSVGHLAEHKGHQVAVEALAALPGVRLVMAGDGPMEARLRRLARTLGVTDRVRFAGILPQEELLWWYGAADALVLASSREGMPNVVLESLACGTPVLATPVGGVPEIVSEPAAGVLMTGRDAASLVEAYRTLFGSPPDRAATRRHAERFAWQPTTEGQLRIFGALRARAGPG